MHLLRTLLLVFLGLSLTQVANAHINPNKGEKGSNPNQSDRIDYRDACDNATEQTDMSINNVRARLTTGGDVWWNGDDGRYIVPKVPAGVDEVSAIFAGAVWLGGKDPGGNFKVAAQTYGRNDSDFDFFPGPLVPDGPDRGTTSKDTCAKWDKFFTVTGEEIQKHIVQFRAAQEKGEAYNPDDIPLGVKGWPARGNPYFFDIHDFDLPNTEQGLAGFWDENGDTQYFPEDGDYPIIEIRGCTEPQFPDEMTFWIYNDAGNIHSETEGEQIRMEIQVQAFAYKASDELNNMTFQRYKLVNRAIESIDSTFFAMWVDPDLGCFTDDYIGCDTTRSMAYVYNQDAQDGTTGVSCDGGVATYGTQIPALGVDYFRGPLDENGKEIGMSSFTYYNNGGFGNPIPATTDPNDVSQYYNYISGRWQDGSPFTFGDDGYQDGEVIRYAFPDPPNITTGWSMCVESLPVGDRRTVQASGPFRLDPGAVNELIIGVVWVPNQVYPCPDISDLLEADDVAQNLFDACFDRLEGPDAPDVDWIELDQEIIAVLSNDTTGVLNNPNEKYAEPVLRIPEGETDTFYLFEGYLLYQLSAPDVTLDDRDDPSKVRLVAQVDVANGISRIFNWDTYKQEDGNTPTVNPYFVPVQKVDGSDNGIRHTFSIKEDQFAEGDRRLINHKKYYFTVIAYAYNEYQAFDPISGSGQEIPYLEGSRNIGDGENSFYTVIPRPILDRVLNSSYGEGPQITRIDGLGTGNNFLDISPETRAEIEKGSFNGEITYQGGEGPFDVTIYNPLDVIDGEYELAFVDDNRNDQELKAPAYWVLKNLSDPGAPIIRSDQSIDTLNEQLVRQYGFSVTIGQVLPAGDSALVERGMGVIGYEEEYLSEEPLQWLFGINDGLTISTPNSSLGGTVYDFVSTATGERDNGIDPNQTLTNIGPGFFIPYYMADWAGKPEDNPQPYLSPAWTSTNNGNNIVRGNTSLAELNNVDIVFTSNKDLWSRCAIVETATRGYENIGLVPEGNRKNFDLRAGASVGKDADPNTGLPVPDGDGTGMGWFPGYAIDVESGQRLNIFFGENSTYDGTLIPEANNGRDMMWNPSGFFYFPPPGGFQPTIYNFFSGGQHYIYVTKSPYDECAKIRQRLRFGAPSNLTKVEALEQVTWAGFTTGILERPLLSYEDGLIPSDLIVKLRVNDPYKVETSFPASASDTRTGTGDNNYHPAYRFTIEGKQADLLTEEGVNEALDQINVVPNPYYAYSDYEDQFSNIVRITNLPAKAVVTIYSLDGKFIRQYTRDEQIADPKGYGINGQQITPHLEWDLKNSAAIPIGSGVYLIHVAAEGLGERTIKFFAINRKFDPTGL